MVESMANRTAMGLGGGSLSFLSSFIIFDDYRFINDLYDLGTVTVFYLLVSMMKPNPTSSAQHSPEEKPLLLMSPWQQYKLIKQAREQGNEHEFFQQWEVIEGMPTAHVDTTLGNVLLLEAIKMQDLLSWEDPGYAEKIVRLLESLRNHFDLNPEDCSWYVAGLRMALGVSEHYPQFLEFVEWWGLEHLQPKDFRPYIPKNGKPGMPLAERVYFTAGKVLLANPPEEPERILFFLAQLQEVSSKYPDFLWLPLIEGKILLALSQPKTALPKIQLFLAGKPREWDAWAALAECASSLNNAKAEIACYCQAISLQRDDSFLVDIRQRLAEVLLSQSLQAEACFEANLATRTAEQTRKVVPEALQRLNERLDCPPEPELRSNRSLYRSTKDTAMEFAFEGFPTVPGLFLQTVPGKRPREVRLLVQTEEKRARTYPSSMASGFIEPGDYIEMVTHPNDPTRGCQIRPLLRRPALPFVKDLVGDLRVHPKGFGFLEDVFVPPHFIPEDAYQIQPNVHVRAVLSLDKNKNQWGWKAVRLTMP